MAKRQAGWSAVMDVRRARALFDEWREGAVLSLGELVTARDYAAVIQNRRECDRLNAALRAAVCAVVPRQEVR